MGDYRNQEIGTDNAQSTTSKIEQSSVINRSMTLNSSSPAEITHKPLYNLYNTPSFKHGGSFKSLYSSPFGSMVSAGNSLKGKVRKFCSIFESRKQPLTPQSPSKPSKLLLTAPNSSDFFSKGVPSPVPDAPFRLPGTEDRVVVYVTSLRGIRRTFQDCHSILMIFRGLRVNLDERDISMDAAYKKELQKVLGESNVSLPQVFIKGKYIGGANVIRQLLEAGELVRLINGLPLGASKPCDSCGDARFIPCTCCNGSRKVFDGDDEQPKRCTECNENGLERCPLCCV